MTKQTRKPRKSTKSRAVELTDESLEKLTGGSQNVRLWDHNFELPRRV